MSYKRAWKKLKQQTCAATINVARNRESVNGWVCPQGNYPEEQASSNLLIPSTPFHVFPTAYPYDVCVVQDTSENCQKVQKEKLILPVYPWQSHSCARTATIRGLLGEVPEPQGIAQSDAYLCQCSNIQLFYAKRRQFYALPQSRIFCLFQAPAYLVLPIHHEKR